LESLLAKQADFLPHRLLKIDTDGYDFQIINSSVDVLRQLQPIVFYEYAPFERPTSVAEGIRTYGSLVAAGYRRFMVYDNFGHYLTYLTENDYDRFIDLNAFLCSNQVNGMVIPYFDICAFTERDLEIFEAVRRQEVNRFIGL
jgi:hypothetical protein